MVAWNVLRFALLVLNATTRSGTARFPSLGMALLSRRHPFV